MATQGFGIRGLGSTAWAQLTLTASALAKRSLQHRRRAALAEQHRLHFDLLCKAMADPSLAAVLDTYETDVPPEKQRQYLFANALYVNALYFHRIGALTVAELYGHVRVMSRNKIFREYWAATRHHRDSLPTSSDEAALGEMMNTLIEEMETLLEDADDEREEWWVVGETPDE
ncbi:DUF6082 family protein [Streptomyces fungicidicus]|jgi:hypothetical protein|uniref:Membrane protein n=1 Tax=Streptomyces griseoflavus Tu4000 TaxID=467200 RepID=D9XTC0_9ACTN|nr:MULTISPECIES: DUF6082 family protein [Streptomyces]EFL38684.1 membrane protein [Streptomyces griseoflavus Tu4000]TQL19744.1 hypothetical protein FBY37_1676 [Streptomyces sp. SLBN-134]